MADSTATARIIIEIVDGEARRAVDRVGTATRRSGRNIGFFNAAMLRLSSAIATVTKALLSMGGVLIAFNLLITIPQKILEGMVAAFRVGLKVIGEFQERVISLQAVLATAFEFAVSPITNFSRAADVAAAVIQELERRVGEMVVGIEDASVAMQTLAAVGSDAVKNAKDLVDLTVLLSNAVAAVTVGQDRQRQLSEEIRSLFTGQFRATALLTRLIFDSSEQLRRFNENIRAGGDAAARAVDDLRSRLEPFALAAQDLGQTFQGLVTTGQTLLSIFARKAFAAIFTDLRAITRQVFDDIDLMQSKFNRLAAIVGAAFRAIADFILKELLGGIGLMQTDTEFFLNQLFRRVPELAGDIAAIFQRIINFVKLLIAFLPVVSLALDAAITVLQLIFKLVVFLGRSFDKLREDSSDLVRVLQLIGETLKYIIIRILSELTGISVQELTLYFDIILGLAKSLVAVLTGTSVEDLGKGLSLLFSGLADTAEPVLGRIHQALVDLTNALTIAGDAQLVWTTRAKVIAATYRGLQYALEAINRLEADRSALQRELNRQGLNNLNILLEQAQLQIRTNRLLSSQVRDLLTLLRLGGGVGVSPARAFSALNESMHRIRIEMENTVGLIDTLTSKLSVAATGQKSFIEEQLDEARQRLDELQGSLVQFLLDLELIRKEIVSIFNQTFASIAESLKTEVFSQFIGAILASFEKEIDRVHVSLKVVFDNLFRAIEENALQIAFAIGNALSSMIQSLVSGTENLGQALKNFLGDVLIFVGQLAVVIGTVGLLLSIFTGNGPGVGASLILLAAGTAAIAAGTLLKGGGAGGGAGVGGGAAGENTGVRQVFEFQRLIEVQQSQERQTERLADAAEALEDATSNIDTLDEGVFIKQGQVLRAANRESRSGTKTRDSKAVAASLLQQGAVRGF